MPVKKGTNNFKGYREDQANFIKDRIDAHLSVLRDSKAKFNSVNKIAGYLAKRLTEDLTTRWDEAGRKTNKPKPMSNSTLFRNPDYRAKIDSFMAGLPLGKGVDSSLIKSSLPMAQAKISEQQAEISNLKNKLAMIENWIEKSGMESDSNRDKKPELESSESINDFVQTARALSLLIEASEGQYAIKDGQLIATYKRVNNVIANKDTLAPFLRWLESQGGHDE